MHARLLALTALVGGCATTPTAPPPPVELRQADERLPAGAALDPRPEVRAAFNEGRFLEARANAASRDGTTQEARELLEQAARAYVEFVERHPDTGWDLPIRYHAARLLSDAGRPVEAAALADRVALEPRASPKSRAMALLLSANARVEANQIEPLRIEYAEQRGSRAVAPRPAPPPWRRFVEAVDAYLEGLGPATREPPGRVLSPAQLALVAAQVDFATDHLSEARSRLGDILDRWPDEPAVFRAAARLRVETFLVAREPERALAAATRVREEAERQAPGRAGDAADAYRAAAEDARRIEASLRFDAAKALVEARPRDAAAAFEALASFPGADAAAALNGAAIARDRAGESDAAISLRARILEAHPDSWVAPDATLQLAAGLARRGDHAEAGRVYAGHARRWPEDPSRCTVLRNGAIQLDRAGRELDAALTYRAFGLDARCAAASPNAAAFALHRAGKALLAARRPGDAREAFQAATRVAGVTDEDVKRRVAEAARLARRLGGESGTSAAGRRP
jgi:tetratricopeptide (TPR) repeat protein